jgi:hypothetical protein
MDTKNTRFLAQQLCLSLFIMLIGCALAACGSNSSTTGSGSSANPTPAQPKNCGTIKQAAGKTVGTSTTVQQTGDCFWQAFQQCQPASMTFAVSGVDTLTTHTFTTKKTATSCVVTDTIKHQIMPRPSKNTTTVTCAGVTKEQNALRFTSCGTQGDLVISLSPKQST